MRHKSGFIWILAAAGLLWAGCGKQEEAPEVVETAPMDYEAAAEPAPARTRTARPAQEEQAPERVRGERRVRAALEAKDYGGAVAMLFSIQAKPEEWEAYRQLYGEVKSTLILAEYESPQAAQALMALRLATAGR